MIRKKPFWDIAKTICIYSVQFLFSNGLRYLSCCSLSIQENNCLLFTSFFVPWTEDLFLWLWGLAFVEWLVSFFGSQRVLNVRRISSFKVRHAVQVWSLQQKVQPLGHSVPRVRSLAGNFYDQTDRSYIFGICPCLCLPPPFSLVLFN